MSESSFTAHTAAAAHGRLTKAEKRRLDRGIIQLWRDGWTGTRIAAHFDVPVTRVRAIVDANGAARTPRLQAITAVAIEDAPIEAWRQAMLPTLEDAADDLDAVDAAKRATVFIGLLRLKPYDNIAVFRDWAHQVTGYAPEEIAAFIGNASRSFLIVDGQPNHATFDAIEADDENSTTELMLLAEVLQGRFRRTADGEYALADAYYDPAGVEA